MKVCFISCHYPPLSRTFRRYQFARLLADGGCHVEAVVHGNVSQRIGGFVEDSDLLEDDPEIKVHRPKAVPWHLSGEILFRMGLIPCPHLNWLRPAIKTGERIAQSGNDVVLGLYPPLTDHLAAWSIARRTGARLVLDFRDEYLGLARGFRRPWARMAEKMVVQRADLVSVATEAVGENLMSRYGLPPEKIHLTMNGYWEDPRADLTYPQRDTVRIVYAGALSGAQGIEVLCQAVEILETTQPELARRIEVGIYGPDNFYLRQKLRPVMKERIQYGGFLSAKQVSPVLAAADICFLSLASEEFGYAVPGKLYEYIAHARPILAALPRGSARDIIEGEGFGLVADCDSAEGLAGKLAEMLDWDKRISFHRQLMEKRQRYAARPHFLSLAERIRAWE
jgi:glycosyltransferase involved in cell wall biosynthesis